MGRAEEAQAGIMESLQQTIQLCAWPLNHLGKAVATLCQVAPSEQATPAALPALPPSHFTDTGMMGTGMMGTGMIDDGTLDQWLTTLAGRYGWEAEPTTVTYRTVAKFLQNGAPSILWLPQQTEQVTGMRFLALLAAKGQQIILLGPDQQRHALPLKALQTLLCANLIAPHLAALEPLLANSAIAPERRQRVQDATLAEMVGATPLRVGWLLRLSPSRPLWQQVQKSYIPSALVVLIAGYLGQLLLTLLAWWLIGGSALSGHFAWVWVLGWGAALLTSIPIQFISNEAQSQFATLLGALFKQRLLFGALRLPQEAVREQGAGQFLKRVLAASAVEQLTFAGGLIAILSLLQVGAAAIILALGAGGWSHLLLLLGWLGVTVLLGWRYLHHSRVWDALHRNMTNDLVERMLGHRTRLAQEDRAHWHDEEDSALDAYLRALQRVDVAGSRLQSFVPRGWMTVGVAAFVFALYQGSHTPSALAITLGGVLLARQGFVTIVLGIQSVVSALLAWSEVTPIFQAAAQLPAEGSRFSASLVPPTPQAGEAVLAMRNLEFGYPTRGRAILQECQLRIQHGDRLLLEGPSGGGKSTLAALLAGLRLPNRGTLLLNGLDRRSVGEEAWRRRVVVVPQFHENYVLTGTLAFNLLMGRRWPPQADDLKDAERVCRHLGLAELLERMPLGLQQIVGESGWQLSHGERSRLFIARALLQNAEVIILDESFGALDAENLQRALAYVLQQAPTLLVIMHP